jgi:hypothetical protein
MRIHKIYLVLAAALFDMKLLTFSVTLSMKMNQISAIVTIRIVPSFEKKSLQI